MVKGVDWPPPCSALSEERPSPVPAYPKGKQVISPRPSYPPKPTSARLPALLAAPSGPRELLCPNPDVRPKINLTPNCPATPTPKPGTSSEFPYVTVTIPNIPASCPRQAHLEKSP